LVHQCGDGLSECFSSGGCFVDRGDGHGRKGSALLQRWQLSRLGQ
jgi:hypothetical protein